MMRKRLSSKKRLSVVERATTVRLPGNSRPARPDDWRAIREDREEVDADFDSVDIDDVVRQARDGRIDVAELDAI